MNKAFKGYKEYSVNLSNHTGDKVNISVIVKNEDLVIEKALEIIDYCWFIPSDCFVVDYKLTSEV